MGVKVTSSAVWAISIACFWVLPAVVAAWIGKTKGRYGAGILLGLLLSWVGVLIVALIGGHEATVEAHSRANVGVILGVLGIAAGIGWSVYTWDLRDTSAGGVSEVVAQFAGVTDAECSSAGYMLVQGRSAEVFDCHEPFVSPSLPLGCFAVIDDAVYDISSSIGRKTCR